MRSACEDEIADRRAHSQKVSDLQKNFKTLMLLTKLCLQAFDAPMKSSASDCCAIMRSQPTASRQFVLVAFHVHYNSFVAYGAMEATRSG